MEPMGGRKKGVVKNRCTAAIFWGPRRSHWERKKVYVTAELNEMRIGEGEDTSRLGGRTCLGVELA